VPGERLQQPNRTSNPAAPNGFWAKNSGIHASERAPAFFSVPSSSAVEPFPLKSTQSCHRTPARGSETPPRPRPVCFLINSDRKQPALGGLQSTLHRSQMRLSSRSAVGKCTDQGQLITVPVCPAGYGPAAHGGGSQQFPTCRQFDAAGLDPLFSAESLLPLRHTLCPFPGSLLGRQAVPLKTYPFAETNRQEVVLFQSASLFICPAHRRVFFSR